MYYAHVVCPIGSWGDNASSVRVEWSLNGSVVSSFDTYPGAYSQLEFDVPENQNVRLDVAAIGADGQMTWSSTGDINVGSYPGGSPTPGPAPGAPQLGALTVSYWNNW